MIAARKPDHPAEGAGGAEGQRGCAGRVLELEALGCKDILEERPEATHREGAEVSAGRA